MDGLREDRILYLLSDETLQALAVGKSVHADTAAIFVKVIGQLPHAPANARDDGSVPIETKFYYDNLKRTGWQLDLRKLTCEHEKLREELDAWSDVEFVMFPGGGRDISKAGTCRRVNKRIYQGTAKHVAFFSATSKFPDIGTYNPVLPYPYMENDYHVAWLALEEGNRHLLLPVIGMSDISCYYAFHLGFRHYALRLREEAEQDMHRRPWSGHTRRSPPPSECHAKRTNDQNSHGQRERQHINQEKQYRTQGERLFRGEDREREQVQESDTRNTSADQRDENKMSNASKGRKRYKGRSSSGKPVDVDYSRWRPSPSPDHQRNSSSSEELHFSRKQRSSRSSEERDYSRRQRSSRSSEERDYSRRQRRSRSSDRAEELSRRRRTSKRSRSKDRVEQVDYSRWSPGSQY